MASVTASLVAVAGFLWLVFGMYVDGAIASHASGVHAQSALRSEVNAIVLEVTKLKATVDRNHTVAMLNNNQNAIDHVRLDRKLDEILAEIK